MVAGHLQEKKGFFYIVLNFVDSDGKRKRKWIATGLPVKGNKRKAEAMLVAERQKYQPAEYQRTADANMLMPLLSLSAVFHRLCKYRPRRRSG